MSPHPPPSAAAPSSVLQSCLLSAVQLPDILTDHLPAMSAAVAADWGRAGKAQLGNRIGAVVMITFFPFLIFFYWISLEHFGGSILDAFSTFSKSDPWLFAYKYLPRPSGDAALLYVAWLAFQVVLYLYMPGPTCQGQLTPGGNLLTYVCNGLNVYIFTHLLAVALVYADLLDPAIIANHWEGLIIAFNIYGMLLSLYSQIKGYFFPTYPNDCKSTGSLIFDFLAGVELNPKVGKHFDLKWFHNSRPGIVAWTLIDLSWAAYQYQRFGYVSKSMIIATYLHGLYVVDLFYNESWYTRTVDISHDHFGWYLAWGDTVFLPTFYTLQSQYLARYPTHLTNFQALLVFTVGTLAYITFRVANWQRDYVRQNRRNAVIWGKPATWIPCTYKTMDGKEHDTILLTCGFWGVARHFNYTSDMLLSFCMCATCGFKHIIPWSYFIFMFIFLQHRMFRDDARCRTKYGKKWEEYCAKVPYWLVPGVY